MFSILVEYMNSDLFMSTSPSSKSSKRPQEVRPWPQLDEREPSIFSGFVKRLRNILDMKYNNFRARVLLGNTAAD